MNMEKRIKRIEDNHSEELTDKEKNFEWNKREIRPRVDAIKKIMN